MQIVQICRRHEVILPLLNLRTIRVRWSITGLSCEGTWLSLVLTACLASSVSSDSMHMKWSEVPAASILMEARLKKSEAIISKRRLSDCSAMSSLELISNLRGPALKPSVLSNCAIEGLPISILTTFTFLLDSNPYLRSSRNAQLVALFSLKLITHMQPGRSSSLRFEKSDFQCNLSCKVIYHTSQSFSKA